MLQAYVTMMYGAIVLSLFFIDYVLGNGFVDFTQELICQIACFVKRSFMEEAKVVRHESPINIPVLFAEIVALSLTIAFLKNYKNSRHRDRMDQLLQESKDSLRQTNEFLEKWRLRRMPTEYSYLDEEPQEIKPLKLEVPLLHMAIVDTLGTTRSQPESGDAGDTINVTDSTLLSVTSLLDDDLDSIPESCHDDKTDDTKTMEVRNRCLQDVVEEDGNL